MFGFRTGFFYDTATTVASASSGMVFSFIRWPTSTNTNIRTQEKKIKIKFNVLCVRLTQNRLSLIVYFAVVTLLLLFGWQCWH